MEYLYSFEKLEVWKDARLFVKKVYALTNTFPATEKFGICQQVQRASVSIVSNLAEGLSRTSLKEQARFTEIAYGSLMEVYCQLLIAYDLEYITEDNLNDCKSEINKIANKLAVLRKSQINRMNERC